VSVPLGIGTYCWSEPGKGGLCVDAVGPVTGVNPLVVSRGARILVPNPAGSPIQQAASYAWRADGPPLLAGATEMVWSFQPGTGVGLVTSITPGGVELTADLEPGRYAVDIRLFFAAGDVGYGLLLEVR
jgi:hypothetical protein